jgi:hypothetical protein
MKYTLIDRDDESSQTGGRACQALIDYRDQYEIVLYSTNDETRLIDLKSMSVILEDDPRDPVIKDDNTDDKYKERIRVMLEKSDAGLGILKETIDLAEKLVTTSSELTGLSPSVQESLRGNLVILRTILSEAMLYNAQLSVAYYD